MSNSDSTFLAHKNWRSHLKDVVPTRKDLICFNITTLSNFRVLLINILNLLLEQSLQLLKDMILIRLWLSLTIVFHRKRIGTIAATNSILVSITFVWTSWSIWIQERRLFVLLWSFRYLSAIYSRWWGVIWWRFFKWICPLGNRLLWWIVFTFAVLSFFERISRLRLFQLTIVRDLKKSSKLRNRNLSFREILKDKINKHFSNLFPSKLFYISC